LEAPSKLPREATYSICPFLSVVFDVRATSLT